MLLLCSVNQICFRPRTPSVGLPRFRANAAHAGGSVSRSAAMNAYQHYTTKQRPGYATAADAVPIDIPQINGGHIDDDPVARFWSKVIKHDGDKCWEWTGMKNKKGYGILKLNGRPVFAHRFSSTLHFGPLKPGECVLHRCDNPGCPNPHHTFRGTRAENIYDRHAKGRTASGVNNGQAKLSPESAAYIRQHYIKRKTPLIYFAKMFGTGTSSIHRVVTGMLWSDPNTETKTNTENENQISFRF